MLLWTLRSTVSLFLSDTEMDSYIVDFSCLDDVEIGETPLAPVKHVANEMWGNIRLVTMPPTLLCSDTSLVAQ